MKRLTGLLLAMLIAMLVVPAVAAAEPSPPVDKYYVVGTLSDGRPEYLYQIAARTLGDGSRYPEIARLNVGRPQPDGATLTDPARLRPGWILLLPGDANGAGVRIGSPPPVQPKRPPADDGGPGLWFAAVVVAALMLLLVLVWWRRLAPRPIPPDKVEVSVFLGRRRVTVRLHGIGVDAEAPPYAWLRGRSSLPGAVMPVVLGRQWLRRLCVDLARTPGVITVDGRVAPRLAEQLRGAGIAVLLVGPVLDGQPGRRIELLAAAQTAEAADRPMAILSRGLRGDELSVARELVARTDGRVVPIVVGPALRGSWSLRAGQ